MQAIIFCNCCFFFLFLLTYSQWSQIRCLPYFHTWCSLSVNLECRSEMCCTRLTENTWHKNSPSAHHRTTSSGYIFPTKACIDNRKKIVKEGYLLHMSSQYGELWPTNGWDWLAGLAPENFNRFRALASLLHQCCSTELCMMFGDLLGWYTIYIHFWGLLPLTEFCQVQRFSWFEQQHTTQAATYIWLGGHHVGHGAHILVYMCVQ